MLKTTTLTSNLLPPAEKKIIRTEKLRRYLVFFGVRALFICLFGALSLLPSYISVKFQSETISKSLRIEKEYIDSKKEGQKAVEQLRIIKNTLPRIKAGLISQAKASENIEVIYSLADQNIAINSLSIKKDGKVSINGFAKTVDDLLKFEQNIRNTNRFQKPEDLDLNVFTKIIESQGVNFNMETNLLEKYKF